MGALHKLRWRPIGLRVAVYGTLAAVIYYLQPIPRCYFNVLGEDSILAPCVEAGEHVLLGARHRSYALVLAAGNHWMAGRVPEAIAASERAFALDPQMEGGNYQILEILFAAGRGQRAIKNYANAIGYFTHALKYAPDHPSLLLERAQTYLEISAFGPALADYDRVIALRPMDGTAYRRRALAKWEGLQDPAGALIDFEKAIDLGDRRSVGYRTQLIDLKVPAP